MKEQAITIARRGKNNLEARNLLREYLQHVILRQLFEKDLLRFLIFHGGTALRIFHDLHRFSEDLDFHLEWPGPDIDFRAKMQKIKSGLALGGYQISVKENYGKTVIPVSIRFHEVLQEAGIALQRRENLSIKVEIDTNPPQGFVTETAFINKYFPFAIKHHDLGSFLAGKLHAILHRRYTKGRDVYDLMFYLSRWPELEPNLEYLDNALVQTGYDGEKITGQDWREEVIRLLEKTDFDGVKKDVESFLESEADLALMTRENLRSLLC
ncbi:MAG: nucleotidyl transferase AbiEii/AbiGii toxin family protein [Candidatus Neomarinimicrobiota bacterium]